MKHDVIKRCLIKGEPVKLVAEEIGYTPFLVYKWIREYREKAVIIDALKNKYSLPEFGYRRIHMLLHRESIKVSEKVVRRIMKQEKYIFLR